jgi:hypothetical protein
VVIPEVDSVRYMGGFRIDVTTLVSLSTHIAILDPGRPPQIQAIRKSEANYTESGYGY